MSKILELLSSLLNRLIYSIIFVCFILIYIISIIYYLIAIGLIKMKYKNSVLLKSQDAQCCYYKNPEKRLILYSVLLSGTIDIDLFRSIFDRVMKRYFRARSYVAKKYGYYFWLPEENFNINEHVLYDPDLSVSTKEEWNNIHRKIYYSFPLSKKKAPWTVHFVRVNSDYEEIVEDGPHFYMTLIYDHCLADGYSILRAHFLGISDEKIPDFSILRTKMYFPEETFFQKFRELMLMFVHVPHYFVEYVWSRRPAFKRNMLTGNLVFSNPVGLNIETVKEIKNAMKVSVRSVLLAIMMGALEKFSKKSSHQLPERMTITIPQSLWKPSDKEEMANKFSFLNVFLPLNEKFCVDRLKEINDILMSPETMENFNFCKVFMQNIGNVFPSFIGKFFAGIHNGSVMFSIAGLDGKPHKILQNRTLVLPDMKRIFPLVINMGILFTTITMGPKVYLVVVSWPSIASTEDVEMMAKNCELELEELKKNICPNSI